MIVTGHRQSRARRLLRVVPGVAFAGVLALALPVLASVPDWLEEPQPTAVSVGPSRVAAEDVPFGADDLSADDPEAEATPEPSPSVTATADPTAEPAPEMSVDAAPVDDVVGAVVEETDTESASGPGGGASGSGGELPDGVTPVDPGDLPSPEPEATEPEAPAPETPAPETPAPETPAPEETEPADPEPQPEPSATQTPQPETSPTSTPTPDTSTTPEASPTPQPTDSGEPSDPGTPDPETPGTETPDPEPTEPETPETPDPEPTEPETPDPEPTGVPASFTLAGSGWGHGIGMSQYGAQGMALEGASASQILTHYYTGTSVKSASTSRDIRVEVFGSGSDSRDTVTFVVRSPGSGDGQWAMLFYPSGSSTATTTWTGKEDEKLRITRSGTSITVTRPSGASATATGTVELRWEGTSYYQSGSSESAYADILTSSGSAATHGDYRHGRLLVTVPGTRLIVANQLDLETEYLRGIAEMPSSWDSAALQAQAITARGYALRQLATYKTSCNCNLYDDARSQNFTGWIKESEGTNAYYGKRWTNAVSATAGKVLYTGSSIATTYYFSSSGGQTENSEDIWTSRLSHLRSVDDRWSLNARNPMRAWTRTITQAQAQSMFGLDDVVSIKVTKRTAGGSDAAATQVTATSASGETATITGADRIRNTVAGGVSPWLWSFTPRY
ncbi:MAG: SpoIID/LytB domain-containing protein [Demequina sp.]|uniref:SpoIID/LytB domain-containing protein n=1 Tax=Demequina sp. TaxID=2050685 RepID=UPI003A8BA0C8